MALTFCEESLGKFSRSFCEIRELSMSFALLNISISPFPCSFSFHELHSSVVIPPKPFRPLSETTTSISSARLTKQSKVWILLLYRQCKVRLDPIQDRNYVGIYTRMFLYTFRTHRVPNIIRGKILI